MDVPLTPVVVDCVTFDRAPLGKRGYHEDQVDTFLDRVQATLSGADTLTARDVREVVFDPAPFIRRGYHEEQVDEFLDLVVEELERRESANTPAPTQRPIPPETPAERTNPMLFALPPSMPSPSTQPLRRDKPSDAPGGPPNSSLSTTTDNSAAAKPPTPSESPIGAAKAATRTDSLTEPPAAAPNNKPAPTTGESPATEAPDTAASRVPSANPPAQPPTNTEPPAQPQAGNPGPAPHQQATPATTDTNERPATPVPPGGPTPTDQPVTVTEPPASNPEPATATAPGNEPISQAGSASGTGQAPAASLADPRTATEPPITLPPGVEAALAEAVKVVEQFEPPSQVAPAAGGEPSAWRDSEHLALPLPPAPPGERGYRPGDVERLMQLLATVLDSTDAVDPAALADLKLSRTFFVGQGYHVGSVDVLRDAWVAELHRRAR